ncbi:hypothetical protein BKA67DRAFT_659198 [Truncatella angustata]|uniref:Siderophore biosynthesis n=1 Tax=Truncatella angustata TaxID=152316 RepID=A0A9P8ZWZ8_9PEZI|nr:uncharacterized protein BKA67DRAFT_659198 [Truncatella angustata]KAH6652489.1 hypothetical protein BKA67DRAFT_659198 [Truncatella angustata]KAH8195576.1 hypothetical protein TruAng_010258 [Truncatella angustata]
MVTRAGLVLAAALFAAPISAKTDMEGCVSSKTVAYGGASLIWYVPDTGEICAFLDCGGGRAPPKTTVPGCGAYSGTASYSPSYLAGYGSDSVASSTSAAAAAGSTEASVTTTTLATGSSAAELPTLTGDSTALTGTISPTITSAASLTTSVSGSTASQASASTSGSSANSSSSSASTAAGAMATAGPLGMFVGVAAGVVAMF